MRLALSTAISFFAVFVLLTACDIQEKRPSYRPLKNSVSSGDLLIQWSKEQGLLNIDDIEARLSDEDRQVFSQSLEWYATESDYGVERLAGKSAKQAVDAINCLKVALPENPQSCMNGDPPSENN
ncbi:MAG: hypothetical protein P8166_01575 [Candidatus Thiodiazotropha sp.]